MTEPNVTCGVCGQVFAPGQEHTEQDWQLHETTPAAPGGLFADPETEARTVFLSGHGDRWKAGAPC